MIGDPDLLIGLRQPDRRTCGPSCLVASRVLLDPSFAGAVRGRGREAAWQAEVLATYRRVTGPVAADGRLQLPWPRPLGTPPWSLARDLSSYGVGYVAKWARRHPARHLGAVHRAVGAGQPVPLYVGDRWLPRHVVLALDERPGRLRVYEPAEGVLAVATHEQIARRQLSLAGWDTLWFVVVPGDLRSGS